MTTDWRALCAELTHEVEQYAGDRGDLMPECAERARAALAAEPVGEGPTPNDEEPDSLERQHWEETGVEEQGQRETLFNHRSFARAVLARWGHQPAPPAGELLKEAAWLRNECSAENADGNWISMSIDQALDLASLLERQAAPAPAAGEVGELVRRLRYAKQNGNSIPSRIHWGLDDGTEHQGSIYVGSNHAADCARAADLLSQRHPTPVPVAERLPGVEDRDHEECCWWFYPETTDTLAVWVLGPGNAEWPISNPPSPAHWLPARALPLPAWEVEK